MQDAGLAFFTVQELVNELLSRKTFLGLVLHSEEELKNDDWRGKQFFQLHLNENLTREEAGRLMDTVATYLNCQT